MAVNNIFGIAGSALTAQSQRMNVAASNMANADSVAGPNGEPYRGKEVEFQVASAAGSQVGGVAVAGVRENPAPFRQEYRPDSPLANAQGYVQMPNVNPTDEMVNMISSARSYEANVNVLSTAKDLALRTLTLGE
ncbi:flagellar basal body rod protein FlgC [Salinisphaera sp. Q1T1-3]|uniref:flagellar basal body rod protein FlgC n=1 Tax=Salinisphaera sp. Q1T1-3 TaxID=2321229 RepID=UPI000E7392DF|nr:flagellar basal body rod protein FlgC [Salinisphaera sp. Q1T1-3]RJS95173.1 flagellar basal body rod protein FlgC [Salinisphaera sp. Q1T1-3]